MIVYLIKTIKIRNHAQLTPTWQDNNALHKEFFTDFAALKYHVCNVGNTVRKEHSSSFNNFYIIKQYIFIHRNKYILL